MMELVRPRYYGLPCSIGKMHLSDYRPIGYYDGLYMYVDA